MGICVNLPTYISTTHCRHQSKVHETLLSLTVPPLEVIAARIIAQTDSKGKGKAVDTAASVLDACEGSRPALYLLMELPLRAVANKSDAMMAQSLELLKELLREFEYANFTRIAKLHTAQIKDSTPAPKAPKLAAATQTMDTVEPTVASQEAGVQLQTPPADMSMNQDVAEVAAIAASLAPPQAAVGTIHDAAGPSVTQNTASNEADIATQHDKARDEKVSACAKMLERMPLDLLRGLTRLLTTSVRWCTPC
jgi:hypothetical protein